MCFLWRPVAGEKEHWVVLSAKQVATEDTVPGRLTVIPKIVQIIDESLIDSKHQDLEQNMKTHDFFHVKRVSLFEPHAVA